MFAGVSIRTCCADHSEARRGFHKNGMGIEVTLVVSDSPPPMRIECCCPTQINRVWFCGQISQDENECYGAAAKAGCPDGIEDILNDLAIPPTRSLQRPDSPYVPTPDHQPQLLSMFIQKGIPRWYHRHPKKTKPRHKDGRISSKCLLARTRPRPLLQHEQNSQVKKYHKQSYRYQMDTRPVAPKGNKK